jgi:hypothetical protein
MSRKHYIAIANVLAGDLATANSVEEAHKVRNIARSLADVFLADNPNFDRWRFYNAVGTGF